MATYTELYDLQNEDELLHKITVAVVVAADAIRQETDDVPNHYNRLVWARSAFANPIGMTPQALWAVLATNKENSVPLILGASDAQVQAAVNAVVDLLAGS